MVRPKNHIPLVIIFSFYLFCLGGCSSIYTGLYGIKKIKVLDEKEINRYAKKYNITESDNYELDTSYFSYLFSLDTNKYELQIKNHYQPLQALYFDEARQLQSFQINCYAGGFPNLNWERNEIMSSFPPQEQAPLDTLLSFEEQLRFIRPLSKSAKLKLENYDYIVFIYWNRFMGRQSKRLIQIVQENSELAAGKKVKLIYINTDNLFAVE